MQNVNRVLLCTSFKSFLWHKGCTDIH